MLTLAFIVYIITAVPCFVYIYTLGLEKKRWRLSIQFDQKKSGWQNFRAQLHEAPGHMMDEFLKIHCPWSKELSIHHRVKDVKWMLERAPGTTRKWSKDWTLMDCKSPTYHPQIANDCFERRSKFWLRNIGAFLIAPIWVLTIAALCVASLSITRGYKFFTGKPIHPQL